MAKYYFWARLASQSEYVDITDEELEDLTGEERNRVIYEYHNEWVRNQYYGDWEEAKNV